MLGCVSGSAAAQTDYYNTDRGRPITIEDAYPTERYAFELQLAPLRLERSRKGAYTWGVEPELAYGILPRTQIEIGFPFAYSDLPSSSRRTGLAGIDASLFYNLNVETNSLPAFGLVAELLLPAGPLGPDKVWPSARAIVTRTIGRLRFHGNAQYTAGASPTADDGGSAEVSRWLAGLAVDRTLPLRALLMTGEVFARRPIRDEEHVEWSAGAGIRFQLDPFLALDAGLGRRLTGDDRSWFVTFGLARAFAIRALMPR
jgi:hypothetical protein